MVALSTLKLIAFFGMCMNAFGTILLWRSSPSGYALGSYANAEMVSSVDARNQKMRFRQRCAIFLIVCGTAIQAPLIFLG